MNATPDFVAGGGISITSDGSVLLTKDELVSPLPAIDRAVAALFTQSQGHPATRPQERTLSERAREGNAGGS